jgi:peptidoglycan/LPS O-acetylase OafA/YrhL
MKLSDCAKGRDNNFNLIRIVASLAVLVTHCFVLATGSEDAEPMGKSLGMTMGTIAVDVFFVTSGFLVTASLLNRQRTLEFIWARALRILPALWAMLLLTVFGLGLLFTALPAATYLSSPGTYLYLAKCSTLLAGVGYQLPGVFDHNPFHGAINGSLWTMRHEARLYVILAAVWFLLRLAPRHRLAAFRMAIVAFAAAAGWWVVARHFSAPDSGPFARLFFMFFAGASFYVLRDIVVLSPWVFGALLAGLLLSLANVDVFYVVYVVVLAYLLLYLAYVPSGLIRRYNALGDYSYGIYIYAFPVQQVVVALLPGISIFKLFLISAPITVILGVLSWHFLERRALSLKAGYVDRTRKLFQSWQPAGRRAG